MGAIKNQSMVSELGFAVQIAAVDSATARSLAQEIEKSVEGWLKLEVCPRLDSEGKRALFIDGELADLDHVLASVDRKDAGIYLILREGAAVPAAWVDGRVDDVLMRPFRGLDVLSKLRHFQAMSEWRETIELNSRYSELIERFQSDLKLAEKLQKAKLPIRFPDIKGFKVTSRYLAGTRSGGNYVDLAESRDGKQVALVLTDASSYQLSSSLLEALPRVMGGLTLEEARSCVTTARRLRDGVLATLTDRDRLSLFYASLSRKDYRLRFVNLGGSRAYYSAPGKPFGELATQGESIQRAVGVRTESEGDVMLEPGGRLALFSDGFIQVAGGVDALRAVLDRFRTADAKDTLNELVYRVKAALKEADDLPAQDCTGAVFDVDSRLIRLA